MRRELEAMLALADRLDRAGEIGVFATLVATRGSSYRPVGSTMLAGPPGTPRAGGVSGGCLEEYIARHGRSLILDRPAALLGFDTSVDGEESNARPTLGCGGHVDVLVERFTPTHRALLEQLHRTCTRGPAAIVTCTVIADAEQDPVVQWRWPGSPDNHRSVGALAEQAIEERRSLHSSIGEGRFDLAIYAEPQARLLICGAGNDAQPLARFAADTDWSVTVADPRVRLAARERFPEVDTVVADDWERLLANGTIRDGDYVVLVTHDLAADVAICQAIAGLRLPYIGVLGPAHRLGWLRDALRSDGGAAAEEAFLDQLRGPIGLDLGGRSPQQIALSIVAELTAHRFDRDGRRLAEIRRPLNVGAGRTSITRSA